MMIDIAARLTCLRRTTRGIIPGGGFRRNSDVCRNHRSRRYRSSHSRENCVRRRPDPTLYRISFSTEAKYYSVGSSSFFHYARGPIFERGGPACIRDDEPGLQSSVLRIVDNALSNYRTTTFHPAGRSESDIFVFTPRGWTDRRSCTAELALDRSAKPNARLLEIRNAEGTLERAPESSLVPVEATAPRAVRKAKP